MICSKDILKLFCRPWLQVECELDRIEIDLLERTKIAAVVDVPVLRIEVAFYLDPGADVSRIFNFNLERADFIPAGNVAVAAESVVFRLEVNQLRLDHEIGDVAEIKLHVLIDGDILE